MADAKQTSQRTSNARGFHTCGAGSVQFELEDPRFRSTETHISEARRAFPRFPSAKCEDRSQLGFWEGTWTVLREPIFARRGTCIGECIPGPRMYDVSISRGHERNRVAFVSQPRRGEDEWQGVVGGRGKRPAIAEVIARRRRDEGYF